MPTFLGFLVATFIKTLLERSDVGILKNLPLAFNTALITAFIMSLVIGTLFYFQDTKWGPKKRKRYFDKSPFSDLLADGFIRKEDEAVGNIDGYTVVVLYTWPNGGSGISISVFFDMDFADRYKGGLTGIKERNKNAVKESCKWDEGVISYMIDFAYKLPKYEKIMDKAQLMVGILKADGLQAEKFVGDSKPKPATDNITSFSAAG